MKLKQVLVALLVVPVLLFGEALVGTEARAQNDLSAFLDEMGSRDFKGYDNVHRNSIEGKVKLRDLLVIRVACTPILNMKQNMERGWSYRGIFQAHLSVNFPDLQSILRIYRKKEKGDPLSYSFCFLFVDRALLSPK